MITIKKSSSGLLFSEENWSDLSLLWDISPNLSDRIVITDDSISLLPGQTRMELLITAPKDSGYVMQSEIEYTPTSKDEKAGCMFKSVTDNIIELESCGDDSVIYKYSKMIVDENNILDAKSSLDGALWTDAGNTKIIDMNKIGYYIGDETTADTIKIKSFYLYKNNNIFLNNVNKTNEIKIFDENDNEITNKFVIKKKKSQICIDGTNILFPISCLKIKIYDRDTKDLITEGELKDVFGGDVYDYEHDIEFYINNELLDSSTYDLGSINKDKVYSLKICNKENIDLKEKVLSIRYYSIYNPGYKLAEISPQGKNNYSNKIELNLLAGEEKVFDLKIKKDPNIISLEDDYIFNIVLE